MDKLCSQLSNIKISSETLLNLHTWQLNRIDDRGVYKELITSERLYHIYSHGEIFIVRGGCYTKLEKIILEECGDDIVVKPYNLQGGMI